MPRSENRRGSYLLEIVLAVAIVAIVFIPIMSSFSTSARQTATIKSYVAAQSVADHALHQARAEVLLGLAEAESSTNVTAEVTDVVPDTVAQLGEVVVTRSIVPVGDSEKLFQIMISVTWNDRYLKAQRSLQLDTLERNEV